MSAEITHYGLLDMQVCIPGEWTDKQVKVFANSKNPAGTTYGWKIRKTGHEALAGDPERVKCLERCEHVHIMLEC